MKKLSPEEAVVLWENEQRYTDREYLMRAVRTTRPQDIGKYPRWKCVSDNFGLGSTHSKLLCIEFGFDPDEIMDGPHCDYCRDRQEAQDA